VDFRESGDSDGTDDCHYNDSLGQKVLLYPDQPNVCTWFDSTCITFGSRETSTADSVGAV